MVSLPDTSMPRASMIRAMPDMPAPPIPMKCTRPRWTAGTGSVGVISPLTARVPTRALHYLDDRLGEEAVGVTAPQRRGRLRHVRDLVDVDQDGQQGVADPLGGQLGVRDQHAAAVLHDRHGVQPLLSVAD